MEFCTPLGFQQNTDIVKTLTSLVVMVTVYLNMNKNSEKHYFSSLCNLFYPQVQDMREMLNGEWVWFQQVLIDSDIMLQKHKEKFKNSLILSSEELKKKIQTTLQEFNSTGHNSLSKSH